MKLKLPLAAAFVAVLSLSACGGSGGNASSSSVASPAQLSYTDSVLGTGAPVTTGMKVNVTYSLWLYSATASDHKGSFIESGPFSFTVGAGQTISGFDQGVLGMLVGGTRTVLVPASLGYGASGSAPKIPPNTGLVFDLTLNSVQ